MPSCLVEWNRLGNFGRGHYYENFGEIILSLDQWPRRCCLKDFLYRELVAFLFGG